MKRISEPIKKNWRRGFAILLSFILGVNGFTITHSEKKVMAEEKDKVWFTDFEEGITGNAYGNGITRESQNVNGGSQAFRYVQGENKQWDNDFKVETVSGAAIDISQMTKVVAHVKDTQGTNDFPIKLIDQNGKTSEKYTTTKATKDVWSQLEIPLSEYSGIDLTAITEIRIFEWNDGTYYFDDIYFEDNSGNKIVFQDFENFTYINNEETNKVTSKEQQSGQNSLWYHKKENDWKGEEQTVTIETGKKDGVDASGKDYFILWVKDTVGSNAPEVTLIDTDGNSSESIWLDAYSGKTVQNEWTQFAVPMSAFQKNGFNSSKIGKVRLWEWNAGDYYLDDIYFADVKGPEIPVDLPKKAVLQDFEGAPVVKNGEVVDEGAVFGSKAAKYTVASSADPSESSSFYTQSEGAADTTYYSYMVFWLKDTQGANTVKVQLEDEAGNKTGLNWADTITTSDGKALKNEWTEYAIRLNTLSGFDRVDRSKIKGIRIGEWNSGDYYIDDIYFTNSLLPGIPKSNYNSGTYEELTDITLSTVTTGCDIYYTTDGTEPTINSVKYSGPFSISGDAIIKAVAIRQSDNESSRIGEFNYRIKPLPAKGTVYFNTFDSGIGKADAAKGAAISASATEKYHGSGGLTYEMETLSGAPSKEVRSISIKPESGTSVDGRKSKYLVFYVKDMQGYNNTRMFIEDEFGNQASAWTTCSTMYGEWSQYYVDLSSMDGFNSLDLAYISNITFGFYNTGTYHIDEVYLTDYLYTGLPEGGTSELNPGSKEILSTAVPGTYQVFCPVELIAEKEADIYYTTDGTIPDRQSSRYSTGIYIKEPTTIKAIAVKNGIESNVFEFGYIIKPGKPFAVYGQPGTYEEPVVVALRSSEDGTPVYYTLDGSEPLPIPENRYSSPFRIEESATVKSIGYAGGQSSGLSVLEYTIKGTKGNVSKPEASLPEGTYGETRKVTLTTKTKDAVIHYTVNGTIPTAKSPIYKDELEINKTTTVKAIAAKDSQVSQMAEFKYVIQKSPSNFLKTDGKVIRNNYGTGDSVILRGTNAGGWLVTENWQCPVDAIDQLTTLNVFTRRFGETKAQELINYYQDNWWTEADFNLAKEEGVNVLRLPITYFEMLNSDGRLKSTAFKRLDWFIREAKKRDIYVMIDMHGAVGSQNGKDHSGDTSNADIGNFYGNEKNIEKTIYLWQEIAKRYKNEPMVCGYDLLNEPSATQIMQFDVYDRIYKAIRKIDKDHIIYIQGIWNPTDLPDPSLYEWENVVYQYHFYQWDNLNDTDTQVNFIKNKIKLVNESTNYNVPVFIGEFTFFDNEESWRQCLELFEGEGWNYTTWTFKVSDSGEGSSWGLYTGKSNPVFVETDSYETIKEKWGQVRTDEYFTRNNRFADILKDVFAKNQSVKVGYSEGNNSGENNPGGNAGTDNTKDPIAQQPVVENKKSEIVAGITSVKVEKQTANVTMKVSEEDLRKEAAGVNNLLLSIKLEEKELIKQMKKQGIKKVAIHVELPDVLNKEERITVEKIILPKAALSNGKQFKKDIEVTVKQGEKVYTWAFDNNILSRSKRNIIDVNLLVSAKVLEDKGTGINIQFSHSGVLPASARVTLNLSEYEKTGIRPGSRIYLYNRNKDGKFLEVPGNPYTVDKNGNVKIAITHGSDYVLLTQKAPKNQLTSLLEQVNITPKKQTLNSKGTKNRAVTLKTVLPVTLVTVDKFSKKSLDPGVAEIKVTYVSSNPKVAKVNKKGKIEAKKPGKAAITVTALMKDKTKKNYKVVVNVK